MTDTINEKQIRGIKILIALQQVDRTYQSVADEFGVSKQYIQQFACIARKKGVTVPARSHSGGGLPYNWAEIKKAVELKVKSI